MATRPETLPAPATTDEERAYVASQWKLVWWRFRRHRLALVGAGFVIAFYVVAIFPEFLAIHDPRAASDARFYHPPQRVHFLDGWRPARPYVYGIEQFRDPVTLAVGYKADESKRLPIRFFVQGHEYEMWNLFKTNMHLMGVDEPDDGKPMPFYPLGTDRMGRDMFSRLMYATRISMSIGLVGVLVSLFLGVLLGGISGYRGGLVDAAIQRMIEFLRSIPTIPLWLALAAAVPQDWSMTKVYFAITVIISLIGWTTLAREVRGRFLAMREEDFVVAARLYGSGQMRIIFRHMLPSFMSHVIATTSLAVPAIIIAETSLSFLGLGLRQPAISWGVLLFEAQKLQAVAAAPWLLIPGAFILLAVLSLNFLGDGLRDAADPYSVQR
jgi:peptide/nickel transport system permease protein